MFHPLHESLPWYTITFLDYYDNNILNEILRCSTICFITGNEETEDNKNKMIPISSLCLYIDRYTQLQPNQHCVVILNPFEEVQCVS